MALKRKRDDALKKEQGKDQKQDEKEKRKAKRRDKKDQEEKAKKALEAQDMVSYLQEG
jgi:hypothetical protein